jgi:formylglycine-generating enzyme required for sulfatase activity
VGQLGQYAWYDGNAGNAAHPVGQLQSNAWGLYDMHGNVWEWVQDWKGSYTSGTVTDPAGSQSGSARVDRGGSWNNDAKRCRSAYRSGSALATATPASASAC